MISFYELLGLVKEGKQPKIIEYRNRQYIWNEAGYFDNWNTFLSQRMAENNSINYLICEKQIKVLPNYELSYREKLELEKNLKPFKNKIKSITKSRYIYIDGEGYTLRVSFKQKNEIFKLKELEIAIKENTYEGLYLNVEYTSKELGLWEGE